MDYFIVDVFCRNKYSGNQLAVVILEEEISSGMMQDIASEFHFSETSFILKYKNSDEDFNVRIFTPKEEVPFAGHPTLGTAYIIGKEILHGFTGQINLNLKIGVIPVSFQGSKDKEILWMRQKNPEFGKTFDPHAISEIINIDPDEIDGRYPIQEVSTGMLFIIIPLKKLSSVKKSSTNIGAYKKYFSTGSPMPLFLFCPETYEADNQINCRMFADISYGIPEDPATGSANGCLAGYLVKYDYFKTGGIDIKVEQGYEIGRKSLLYLKAEKVEEKITVNIGGQVMKIAEGRLF